jgi:SAM-dependent methyltransferase
MVAEDRHMTGVDLSDPLPIHFYEKALVGERISIQLADGTDIPLPAGQWSETRPGDGSIIERCYGATLDVGCGAGRITAALTAAGVLALGIDISAYAVRLCRRRGAAAVQQDIFAPAPDIGRWQHVVLIDGNIGIYADAAALLERCKELLHENGTIIVEASSPGTGNQKLLVRLLDGSTPSRPFSWLLCDVGSIKAVGLSVGLQATAEWAVNGRWFVELSSSTQHD